MCREKYRPKEAWKDLHLSYRLILGTETIKNTRNTKTVKESKVWEKDSLISRVNNTLVDWNIQFSPKIYKEYNEIGKYEPHKGKKCINRNCPWKRLDGSLIRQSLKTVAFKMLKEQKEDKEKVKKKRK